MHYSLHYHYTKIKFIKIKSKENEKIERHTKNWKRIKIILSALHAITQAQIIDLNKFLQFSPN